MSLGNDTTAVKSRTGFFVGANNQSSCYARVVVAAGLVKVVGGASIDMGDTVPASDNSFRVSVVAERVVDDPGGDMGVEVPAAALIATLEAAFSRQAWPIGYSNGRLAIISPACDVIGYDFEEPDQVPDPTP